MTSQRLESSQWVLQGLRTWPLWPALSSNTPLQQNGPPCCVSSTLASCSPLCQEHCSRASCLCPNLNWHITFSMKPSSLIKFKVVPLLKYSHSSSLFYFSLYHLSMFKVLSNSFPYFISFPSSFQTERKAVSPVSITGSNTVNVQWIFFEWMNEPTFLK